MLFLAGGTQEPSSRFRAHQFFPHFEARGIECTSRTAYGEAYNAVSRTPWAAPYKLACRLKRAVQTLDSAAWDVVFLQRTALPHTALPERLASRRNPRLVYDFDDSVFLGADGLPDTRRERAFRDAIALSAHVIAGNSFLAEYAAAPAKTSMIPTVVDTERFRPGPRQREGRPVVVGWMGTASNFDNLPVLVPAIERLLADNPDVIFRIVSNDVFAPLADHPRVEQVRWSEATELAQLQDFDVGVMPLNDTPWTRGKCGFKMIQYMAVGCPVVASAVGANVDIFRGSGAGALVADGEDWYGPLRALASDEALRRRCGAAARVRADASYSVASVVDRYVEIFERVRLRGVRRAA